MQLSWWGWREKERDREREFGVTRGELGRVLYVHQLHQREDSQNLKLS